MALLLIFGATLASSLVSLQATEFLGAQGRGHSVSKEVVEQMLLMELPGSSSAARLSALKEQFQTVFAALPKNEKGQLEPSTVRYVLHRHFVQKHGWHVKGLDPEGDGWNSSSVSPSDDIMKGLAPAYIQELFAKRLHGDGLQVEDLAVFAATLDDLIFQESLGGLKDAYDKLHVSTGEVVSDDVFDMAVRAFLSNLIGGDYAKFDGIEDMPDLEALARDFFPEYDDIVMWVRDLFRTQDYRAISSSNPFVKKDGVSFDRAADLLQDVVHHFGRLSEAECRTLREDLVNMEQAGTGRVLLSDFYANRELQLHESVDYLRNLGALEDEGGPPRLIIANYISSPSRCMPFSSYYSVCCADTCDTLMGSLERDIGHPRASPARIAELVTALPSETVDAPRNLSTVLLARLDEIASHHNGHVPIHGRLFLQWMHHAYPRECSYPHAAGTTKPVTQDEWLRMNSKIDDAMATEDEQKSHVSAEPLSKPMGLEDLPWSAVEELVAVHKKDSPPAARGYLRIVVCLVVLLSFALPLLRASAALLGERPEDKALHFV